MHPIPCAKKGRGTAPVVNLKPLNQKIPYDQDGGDTYVEKPVNEGRLFSQNRSDYLTIPIWHKHQTFLRFLWKDSM